MLTARLPVTLHVVGQQFRRMPEPFAELRRLLTGSGPVRMGEWGYIEDRRRYRQLLAHSAVVLSTALSFATLPLLLWFVLPGAAT